MTNTPEHIAIIMDGNGRWAQERGHSRFYGHVRGVKRVKEIVKACDSQGIKFLTLYAFSAENWKRPKLEVNILMKILRKFLISERNELNENNVRFKTIGEIERLPEEVQNELLKTVELTKNNSGLCFSLALSYGSQQEILEACKNIYNKINSGTLKLSNLSVDVFSENLQSSFLPPPDLIIRTSGEHRLSNFLLWQAAYSELYISQTHWPDFTKTHLKNAIRSFANRDRRFGQISQHNTIEAHQTNSSDMLQ